VSDRKTPARLTRVLGGEEQPGMVLKRDDEKREGGQCLLLRASSQRKDIQGNGLREKSVAKGKKIGPRA